MILKFDVKLQRGNEPDYSVEEKIEPSLMVSFFMHFLNKITHFLQFKNCNAISKSANSIQRYGLS